MRVHSQARWWLTLQVATAGALACLRGVPRVRHLANRTWHDAPASTPCVVLGVPSLVRMDVIATPPLPAPRTAPRHPVPAHALVLCTGNDQISLELLDVFKHVAGVAAPIATSNGFRTRARAYWQGQGGRFPPLPTLDSTLRHGQYPVGLAHLRGSARTLTCVCCDAVWTHDYAARVCCALQNSSPQAHLFREGSLGSALVHLLHTGGEAFTCFMCEAVRIIVQEAAQRRARAALAMEARGWFQPLDASSLVLELGDLPLPPRLLPLAEGMHTYPSTTLHLVLLNGARLVVPPTANQKCVKGHVVRSDESGPLRQTLLQAGACGAKGDVTVLMVLQEDAFREVVGGTAELLAEWRASGGQSGASRLRRLLADQRAAMPMAGFLADGSPVRTFEDNAAYLGATLLARTHAEAAYQHGQQAPLDKGNCHCCLSQLCSMRSTTLCTDCACLLEHPIARGHSSLGRSRGGRVGGVEDPAQLLPHRTVARYWGMTSEAAALGAQLLPPDEALLRSSGAILEIDALVPRHESPDGGTKSVGNPLVTYPIQPYFSSLMLLTPDAEWVHHYVPRLQEMRAGVAHAEMLLLVTIDDLCPMAEVDHEGNEVEAKISDVTGSGHSQGDSRSGFISGIARVAEDASRCSSYEQLCHAAVRRSGHVERRTGGGYLSQAGCGVHVDATPDHETVIEMYVGEVCALPAERRAAVVDELTALAGELGACVLVPDARVALRVRPLRDVMVAHLRFWQHFSLQHTILGRFGTAVHIT